MNARAAGAAALFALAALQPLWHGWIAPPTVLPLALVLAVAMLPLLLAVFVWSRNRPRGLIVGGTFSLFYFCHGVMEAWSEPRVRALALAECVLVLVLVGAIGWAALAEKRARRAALTVAAPGANR